MNTAIRLAARVVFGLGVVVVTLLSLMPSAVLPAPDIWDKAQHFMAYGVLGLCGAIGFPTRPTTRRIVIGLVLLGIALEIGQLFVAGRDGTFGDALANGLGAVTGLSAAQLARLLGNRLLTPRAVRNAPRG